MNAPFTPPKTEEVTVGPVTFDITLLMLPTDPATVAERVANLRAMDPFGDVEMIDDVVVRTANDTISFFTKKVAELTAARQMSDTDSFNALLGTMAAVSEMTSCMIDGLLGAASDHITATDGGEG